MDDRQVILEQYRIYNDSKDRFIDRNFVVNRFYLVLTLVLLFIVSLLKQLSPLQFLTIEMILSVAGMGIAMLWWLNQDAYSFLIKVKYAFVLEKLEEKLASNPNNMEFKALVELQQKKKAFLFSDIQKGLAVLALITFMVYLIIDVIPFVLVMLGFPAK